ncbi:hypothetical protein CLAFUW4_14265 [Fulvia fulva]|uniref:Uncharacterized protein n=1 Tax=Passalora fulva TaxID=5499 RepID=A0A9Q8PMR7_PASFU|nr:uncharacterized protein CLAFUR5_14098 [Fulvia fulva]KAK4609336.1 hypothetical protein CLAFUR4_14266 [Fulvia fulva]KAK4610032.1 hypothetical protein CLAFUR0_14270 [Fulvia fulva]UJO25401.1 hypothetical protein CLAFUR5_14098 [Fulvia fulva]WPV22936.1 hypothetical protein CLAFUW4_14265 [Fulvia fulva]WPV37570.1 hypothetical protein CLAFUW7_14274 [Fulvia fulva]
MQLHHITAFIASLALTANAIPVPDDGPAMEASLQARADQANEPYDRQVHPDELDALLTHRDLEDFDVDAPLTRRDAEPEESHLTKRFLDNDSYDLDVYDDRIFWRNGRRNFFGNRGGFYGRNRGVRFFNGRRGYGYNYNWNNRVW